MIFIFSSNGFSFKHIALMLLSSTFFFIYCFYIFFISSYFKCFLCFMCLYRRKIHINELIFSQFVRKILIFALHSCVLFVIFQIISQSIARSFYSSLWNSVFVLPFSIRRIRYDVL